METETGDVEKRLVDGEPLDGRGELLENREDVTRRLGVRRVVRGHEAGVGAASSRFGNRHCRTDAELASLVRGRGDDAPVAEPADDDRDAAE